MANNAADTTRRQAGGAPPLTAKLLLGTLIVYAVLANIAWPLVWHNAAKMLRTDLDRALLATTEEDLSVRERLAPFIEPHKRFEQIVEQLRGFGFEPKPILGSYIYRRRTETGPSGPDGRMWTTVVEGNRQLDERDGVYMGRLVRTIPGGLMREHTVTVEIISRADHSTTWRVRKTTMGRAPSLW